VAMVLGVLIAPNLGIDKKGGFQFIQEYTGFFSPGIFAMFILGFFWKKTTSSAALFATLGGFVMSVGLKFLPRYVDLSGLANFGFAAVSPDPADHGAYVIPFMDRMTIVFAACVVVMVLISLWETRRGVTTHGLEIDSSMFRPNRSFVLGASVVVVLVTVLYTVFW
jgi:SSS family solute:Na+ symporter